MPKVLRILLSTLVVAAAAAASAQDVLPGPITLGLYFDAEQNLADISIGEPTSVDAYLVITEATVQEIAGWEIKLTMNGAAISDVVVPGGTNLLETGPENFAAALSTPLPANPRTKLAVFTIFSEATEDVFLYLGAMDGGTLGGSLPAVMLADGTWYHVDVPGGDPTRPVAGIDSTLPTDVSSWGSVKGLFR